MESRRLDFIDSIRFLSIAVIIIHHNLMQFFPAAYERLSAAETKYFGYPAMFCVYIFGMLLGFFAAGSAKKDSGEYISRRYLQFFFGVASVELTALLVSFVYSTVGMRPNALSASSTYFDAGRYTVASLISDSVFLRSAMVESFWCIGAFFICSAAIHLICRFTSGKNALLRSAIFLALFVLGAVYGASTTNYVFAACSLGAVLRIIASSGFQLFSKWYVRLPLWLALPLLSVFKCSAALDIVRYSFMAFLLLLLLYNSPLLKKILSVKPLPALGRISFYMFLIHTPVHNLMTYFLLGNVLPFTSPNEQLVLSLVSSLAVTIALSLLLDLLFKKLVNPLIDRIVSGTAADAR